MGPIPDFVFKVSDVSRHLETVTSKYDTLHHPWTLHTILMGFLTAYHSPGSDSSPRITETYIRVESSDIFYCIDSKNQYTRNILWFMMNEKSSSVHDMDHIRAMFDPAINISATVNDHHATHVTCFSVGSTGKVSHQNCPAKRKETTEKTKHSVVHNDTYSRRTTINSDFMYNFDFFLKSFQNSDHAKVEQEIESLVFSMQVYFRHLANTYDDLHSEYFCVFLHSVLQYQFSTFSSNVYIHAFDLHWFIVYHGVDVLRHMIFKQRDYLDVMCVSDQTFHVEGVGLKIYMSMDSKLVVNVRQDHRYCYQTFPSLMNACVQNDVSGQRVIYKMVNYYTDYWNQSLVLLRSYLIGQFIGASTYNSKNHNKYEIQISDDSRTDLFFKFTNAQNKTCGIKIPTVNLSEGYLQIGKDVTLDKNKSNYKVDVTKYMKQHNKICTSKNQTCNADALSEDITRVHEALNKTGITLSDRTIEYMAAMEGFLVDEWETVKTIKSTKDTTILFLSNSYEKVLISIKGKENHYAQANGSQSINIDTNIQGIIFKLFHTNPQLSKITLIVLQQANNNQLQKVRIQKIVAENTTRHCGVFCEKSTKILCSTQETCRIVEKEISQKYLNDYSRKCEHKNLCFSHDFSESAKQTRKAIKRSVSTREWNLERKTLISGFFVEVVALSKMEIKINNQSTPHVLIHYPQNFQMAQIKSTRISEDLFTTNRLIQNWHYARHRFKNRSIIFLQEFPEDYTINNNSQWSSNVFHIDQQEYTSSTYQGGEKLQTRLTRHFDFQVQNKSRHSVDVFHHKNFDHTRQIDITGQYVNGTATNDAFIYEPPRSSRGKTMSIYGNGGQDGVFIMNDESPIQVTGQRNRVDITVNPGPKSTTSNVSYYDMAMLKGRDSTADHVTLSSCSLEHLDTNGGNNARDTDVITIGKEYTACKHDLNIVINRFTSVFNHASQGSFVYTVSQNVDTAAHLFIILSGNESSTASHRIFIQLPIDGFQISLAEHTPKQKTYTLTTRGQILLTVSVLHGKLTPDTFVSVQFTDGTEINMLTGALRLVFHAFVNDRNYLETFKSNFPWSKANTYMFTRQNESRSILNTRLESRYAAVDSKNDAKHTLTVFATDARYPSKIDFDTSIVLVTIPVICYQSCIFKPIHLKRLPESMLVISLKNLAFLAAEKQAKVELTTTLEPTTLHIEIQMRYQSEKNTSVGTISVDIDTETTVQNTHILFELEAMVELKLDRKNNYQHVLKSVPIHVENDTELVILLPEVSVRPVSLTLDGRFINSYMEYSYWGSRFIVAFECKKEIEDSCVPNLMIVMYKCYTDAQAFKEVEIRSQHAGYKFKK